MLTRSLALTFIGVLAGCAAAGEPEGASSSSDLVAGSDTVRLRRVCTIDDVRPRTFEVAAGADPTHVNLGLITSRYLGWAEVSLGPAPAYAVSLTTSRTPVWTAGATTTAEVTKESVRIGDEVSLRDLDLWPGHVVSCTATLSTG